jgi:citrate lyase subunit beta / citryl-CoA lyase
METRIQRSMLILPAHVGRFVEKAYTRNADAIVLDLEDSVPMAKKEEARRSLKDAVQLAGRGAAEVFVRVNADGLLLDEDLRSAVQPGLHGIFLPKVETAEDVISVERRIAELEAASGLISGAVKLSIHIESPLGVLNMREIATAGSRIESMSLGVDDYCLGLEIEPSDESMELLLPLSMLVIVCRSVGIIPLGTLGSVARLSDLDAFERAAEKGRRLGCQGAFCVHPDQVAILNRVFTPPSSRTIQAKKVIAAFEQGRTEGRAAIRLNDRMVDTPVYERAGLLLRRAQAIEELERRKAAAVARIKE